MAKILIVDDDSRIRELLTELFLANGHEVVSGKDGSEGLSKAISEKPDLIIMDLNMPVMDGFKATKEIKSSPETAKIPIIVLSAEGGDRNRDAIYDSGADGFVTKPLDLQRFLARATEFLAT